MGCVSSNMLDHDDDFPQLGSSGFGNHIVSLTSSTYGLLTLDPPSPNTHHHPLTPPRLAVGSLFHCPLPEPRTLLSQPEVINAWELMAGLDTDSFRLSLPPPTKPTSSLLPTIAEFKPFVFKDKENSNPNWPLRHNNVLKALDVEKPSSIKYLLEGFEKRCPPNGERKVVVYTTTLRGVRQTFEACNAVRAALQGIGVLMSERDVSMDRGFREELRELMEGKESDAMVPPRVFVKGRYIGGAEEVLRIHEEGCLGELLEGLSKARVGVVCEGCGGVRFLPCFKCNGSCKLVMLVNAQAQTQQQYQQQQNQQGRKVVVRCPDCNENGLVLCSICS